MKLHMVIIEWYSLISGIITSPISKSKEEIARGSLSNVIFESYPIRDSKQQPAGS